MLSETMLREEASWNRPYRNGRRFLRTDVLIIGGGIVGASLAYEFAKYNLDTVLLEKEAELLGMVAKNSR